MNYDKNSFLAGISVGRTLKGWAGGAGGLGAFGVKSIRVFNIPPVRLVESRGTISVAATLPVYTVPATVLVSSVEVK